MPEEGVETPQGPEEIGQSQFDRLATVLESRQQEGCNVVGWGGDNSSLRTSVQSRDLFPTSAFAVVAEGVSRYKREGNYIADDPSLMRDFAKALSSGAEVFPQAANINEAQLKDQIKRYLESHGGTFNDSIEWQSFIKAQADTINKKAAAWEAANG